MIDDIWLAPRNKDNSGEAVLQYHLVVIFWRGLVINDGCENLSTKEFIDCFYPVVYMQFLVDMVNVFAYGLWTYKKVIGYFLIEQSFW